MRAWIQRTTARIQSALEPFWTEPNPAPPDGETPPTPPSPPSPPTRLSHDDYRKKFRGKYQGASSPGDNDRLAKALEQAYDARKFEIEMYWKRAAYFWTFIGAAFVGYAAFFNADTPHAFAALLMSQIGFVFTLAWYLVNRGSKFWQENWENHVELLENSITGPLYKITAQRDPLKPKHLTTWDDRWIGPRAYSVSKINGMVSLYVMVIWMELAFGAAAATWTNELHTLVTAWGIWPRSGARFAVILGLIVPTLFVYRGFKKHLGTHPGGHQPALTLRTTTVSEPPLGVMSGQTNVKAKDL